MTDNRPGSWVETDTLGPFWVNGVAVTHTQTPTDVGPDFCKECSEATGDWVKWPCVGSVTGILGPDWTGDSDSVAFVQEQRR